MANRELHLLIVRLDFSGEESYPNALHVGPYNAGRADVFASLGPELPFRGDSIDEVFLGSSLALVDDLVATVEEIWRVTKSGALVHARLPHASSSWSSSRNPRARKLFTVETFRFFDPEARDRCTSAAFEIERARLRVKAPGAHRNSAGGLVRGIENVLNRSRGMQYRSERWLAPLFGGFEEFSIVLSTVKTPPIH